jgi:hypothetical protein
VARPGTGKTVVALHRAAYLAFTRQDAVLYVTKHPALAAYVSDVLPSTGEDDVPVASLADLYAERATRRDSPPGVARLKGDARLVTAVGRAVAFFQDLPQETVVADLADGEVVVRPPHWREALETCEETQHVPRRAELLESWPLTASGAGGPTVPVRRCRSARGACSPASSRGGAGPPPAPPGSGGCAAAASPPASRPRPSR